MIRQAGSGCLVVRSRMMVMGLPGFFLFGAERQSYHS